MQGAGVFVPKAPQQIEVLGKNGSSVWASTVEVEGPSEGITQALPPCAGGVEAF